MAEVYPTIEELESEPKKRKTFSVNVQRLYTYMKGILGVGPHIRWSIPKTSFIYYKPARDINYRYTGIPIGVSAVRTIRKLPVG